MERKICFIVSGLGYSGAEIVLNRFLKSNLTINPYILILYKNELVMEKFIDLYGKEKVYSLNLEHSQFNIRFLPFCESKKLEKNFLEYINLINPDLVYINNTTETMLISRLIVDLPTICHVHDMKSHTRSPIRKYFTTKAIKKCDKAITVSNACMNDWDLNMKVVYNGLNDNMFKYRKISKIEQIGFVGGLTNRKGIDVLFNTLDEIIKLNNKIVINIAFNGGEEVYLQKLKIYKKKYKNRINVFENLDEINIIKFYDSIDLLIVPSRHDPLPTVIMEACARGTLVIGSDIDGIPELLNNNKELLFNLNEDELIKRIKYISNMSQDELETLTFKLHRFAKDSFNEGIKRKIINDIIKNTANKGFLKS
ncbi:MAG: glycosyltransferase family 4 protein [Clostridium sp.]|uniref:glycosyltransferase family 4 protein n=1 Tax=Clostridium sp. TaxID=1506 RepID=UPI003F2F9ECF